MSKKQKTQPITDNQLPYTKPSIVKVKVDFNFLKLKYLVLFLALATGIAGAIIAIYAYIKFTTPADLNIAVIAESENLTEAEIKTLTEKVSRIAALPQDEMPTVLTVTDLTKLKSNPFFSDAKLKYKILIFKKTGKIILYDPFGHKIVNIGPYSENQAPPFPSPTAQYGSPQLSSSPTPSQEPSPSPN